MRKVFISYSHKDEELKRQFETHLSGLKRQKLIDVWDDRQVLIGEKWDEKIKQKLTNSDIVIFLISSDFLASEYINEIEIKETISRHKASEVYLAPIFLRPCDFESSILSSFQGVPRDAKFITTWDCIDSAFLSVVQELKKIISEFKKVVSTTPELKIQKEISSNDCDTPPDIVKWVGRNEELEILKSSHFKVIFITGFGGQGKSSLATKYVYEQAEKNVYESWDWRDFKEEENRLKTKLIEIIRRYSKSEVLLSDLKDVTYEELVDLVFITINDKKVLFVFDNIDSYIDYESFTPQDGFKQLIANALTRKHNCKFVFTCRPFIKKADVGFFQIELSGLKFESAVQLLDEYNISIKQEKKEALYKELHRITNGHPLWLNLLGAQAVSGVEKLEEFIINISAHTKFDEDDISKILSNEIIGVVWNSLNYKQQKLLRCLSEIIKAEKREDLAKMVENELTYNQFERSISKLKLLNLVVTKTKDSTKEEIELHPLVKSYVKSKYPPNERSKYISIIIDYYNKITYVLKKRLSGNESLSFYENWTNKVELAINKNDYPLALSALQEITDSILTAGYFEEYFRISKLLFKHIDFNKYYNNETPYFITQIISIVNLASEIGEFETAREVLESFKSVIKSKGRDYVIYCKLECSFYWNKLDNTEAIKWGEIALNLVKSGKLEIDFDLEHTLNLAKRDSREDKNVKEALTFFLKGNDIDILTTTPINENLSAHFFGNLGRCYYFYKEYAYAKALLYRSFHLCYVIENSSKFLNRGYASYWMGQILQKEGENKMAYFFFSNCIYYWKKHSPHRAKRVDDERKVLQREIPDIEDIFKMDENTIENQCKIWNEKKMQSTINY